MDPTSSTGLENAPHRLSRRHVIVGATAVTMAGAAGAVFFRRALGRAQVRGEAVATRRPLIQASDGDWMAQVGTTFLVQGGYRLRLAGVRTIGPANARVASMSRSRAFVAVFDVLDGRTLAGDLIYSVQHPSSGWMPIYFSETDSPSRILAVFN